MHIITNWQPRPLVSWQDLPIKVQSDFDYVDENDRFSDRFVCYRGEWSDVFDTQRIEPDSGRPHPMGWAMRVHPGSPLALFDSIESESYFSGRLYRLTDDGESVIVARYFS